SRTSDVESPEAGSVNTARIGEGCGAGVACTTGGGAEGADEEPEPPQPANPWASSTTIPVNALRRQTMTSSLAFRWQPGPVRDRSRDPGSSPIHQGDRVSGVGQRSKRRKVAYPA